MTVMKRSKKAAQIQEQRDQLPIAKGKAAIVREIEKNDVTIILGETGSGKTTQIPQYLLECDFIRGQIACTQPRRVAATSLANRVSVEQERPLGSLVGYSVRFDERTSSQTRIKYLTDGMLVREMLGDRLLERYSVIIVDEAHERTLRTDVVLASLKNILRERNTPRLVGGSSARNPLKVVVMSATLDAEKFSKFFDNAKVLYVKGRQHPVTIYHTSTSQMDYVDAALRTFFQIHVDNPPGDVLVFLPGQDDIETLQASIDSYSRQLPQDALGVIICPLYSSLPNAQQSKIFESTPPGMRKCILATNIAETSITVSGVKYVIDSGKQKEKRRLTRVTGGGFDTLLTTDVTQSSAVQRAGRAGREGHGHCFRLYTESAFNSLQVSAEPEIRRSELTSAMLQLKCVGQDLETLEFMDPPDPEYIGAALRTLFLLGALDSSKALTKLGRSMAAFPLEPIYAAAILASVDNGCVSEVIDIVSLISASPLFPDSANVRDAATEARSKFRHPSGDHLTKLNVLRAYEEILANNANKGHVKDWCHRNFVSMRALVEALDIRKQLRRVCDSTRINWKTSCGQEEGPVLRSMVRGLVLQTALLQPDGTYKQAIGATIIKIHPSSSLSDKKYPAIIYDELMFTSQIYARGVSAVPKSYLATVPMLMSSRKQG